LQAPDVRGQAAQARLEGGERGLQAGQAGVAGEDLVFFLNGGCFFFFFFFFFF